jgi:hypothetical protein
MKKTRRSITTLEQHEVLTVRSSGLHVRALCPRCSDRVVLITLDEAVKLSGVSSRTIHKGIEKDSIHFMETADGLVQICPVSLLGHIDRPNASAEPNNFSVKT